MIKIPIKTRLPVEAWTLAALVTLFSLLSSLVPHPGTNTDATSMAHAKMVTDNYTLFTSAIR